LSILPILYLFIGGQVQNVIQQPAYQIQTAAQTTVSYCSLKTLF